MGRNDKNQTTTTTMSKLIAACISWKDELETGKKKYSQLKSTIFQDIDTGRVRPILELIEIKLIKIPNRPKTDSEKWMEHNTQTAIGRSLW